MTSARRSSIAGVWYPADPKELEALVDSCVAAAPAVHASGQLVALVSPHAGPIYSGRIAAAGYQLLEGADIDSVLLLGPCHRGGDGLAVIPEGAIETPLGVVHIDAALASMLRQLAPEIRASAEPHVHEHSLEVQLPFLQRFLPGVPVTLVLMRDQTPGTVALAASAIGRALAGLDRKVLLVASSDLSHHETRAVAAKLDGRVVECLERFDPSGLERLMMDNPRHACGGGPMISILTAARTLGATDAKVLAYGDSGDVNGDLEGVVGYVSAAFSRSASS